ncbi:MAG: hypothetical protein JO182_09830 [Acidobacteriaceae bacterium]|nr:hypothetical protein [Acidobacteriaceae bacterium]
MSSPVNLHTPTRGNVTWYIGTSSLSVYNPVAKPVTWFAAPFSWHASPLLYRESKRW